MLVHQQPYVGYFVKEYISFIVIIYCRFSEAISTKKYVKYDYTAYYILIKSFPSLLNILLHPL